MVFNEEANQLDMAVPRRIMQRRSAAIADRPQIEAKLGHESHRFELIPGSRAVEKLTAFRPTFFNMSGSNWRIDNAVSESARLQAPIEPVHRTCRLGLRSVREH
jgi:hypothetical protein